MKIYGFKPPKPRRNSTSIFEDEEHTKNTKNIQRSHEERKEHMKNAKNEGFLTNAVRDSL